MYTAPLALNGVIGTLSATDANTGQTLTYSITGGTDSTAFNISGAQLRSSVSGLRTATLQVTVSVDDGAGGTASSTFTVTAGLLRTPLPACLLADAHERHMYVYTHDQWIDT